MSVNLICVPWAVAPEVVRPLSGMQDARVAESWFLKVWAVEHTHGTHLESLLQRRVPSPTADPLNLKLRGGMELWALQQVPRGLSHVHQRWTTVGWSSQLPLGWCWAQVLLTFSLLFLSPPPTIFNSLMELRTITSLLKITHSGWNKCFLFRADYKNTTFERPQLALLLCIMCFGISPWKSFL